MTIRLLNVPSNIHKGKRAIYDVNGKKEISYPFDSIGPFILDGATNQMIASATIIVCNDQGEPIDKILCQINSKGKLIGSLVESEKLGIILIDQGTQIVLLVQRVLEKNLINDSKKLVVEK